MDRMAVNFRGGCTWGDPPSEVSLISISRRDGNNGV